MAGSGMQMMQVMREAVLMSVTSRTMGRAKMPAPSPLIPLTIPPRVQPVKQMKNDAQSIKWLYGAVLSL